MEKLDENLIRKISLGKNEPEWMLEFRLNSYRKFLELDNPNFGPKIDINFDDILDCIVKMMEQRDPVVV